MQTFTGVLEGFENTSRFRDETRSKNSPKQPVTLEGNSQLGLDCPNSKASENSSEAIRRAGGASRPDVLGWKDAEGLAS